MLKDDIYPFGTPKAAVFVSGAGIVAPEAAVRKSWQRRKDARPQEILEAALRAFTQNGFAATHMEDIARRAGITKGTIYLYYQSKEDLFGALVRESIGKELAAIVAEISSLDVSAQDKLQAFFAAIGRCFSERDRGVLLKLIFAESSRFPKLASLYRVEIVQKIAACLNGIGSSGGKQDLYRLPAEQIAQLCLAPALLASLWQPAMKRSDGDEESAIAAAQLGVVFRGAVIGATEVAA